MEGTSISGESCEKITAVGMMNEQANCTPLKASRRRVSMNSPRHTLRSQTDAYEANAIVDCKTEQGAHTTRQQTKSTNESHLGVPPPKK